MAILDKIDTIAIVMMENRSFDHVLGHLRMPAFGNRQDVEGLVDPTNNPNYVNFVGAEGFAPFPRADAPFPHDTPHSRSAVAAQLAPSPAGAFTMSGFVQAYVDSTGDRVQAPPPMGFLTPADVPMSSFLAREFAICDHWFAPLPNETFPNRCVAFSGESLIDDGTLHLAAGIPTNPGTHICDWLDKRQVPWRVYHSGMSFFTLFGSTGVVLSDNFQPFERLATDLARDPAADDPRVIIIEPEYVDVPVHFGRVPNDNHPPLPMGPGEHFLREIYTALSSNRARWQRTLLVVLYDEHGGFFDHVPPPRFSTPVPTGALFQRPYDSLGVRVPAFIASPWVARGSCFKGRMDHTSLLQLIAERFTKSPDYTPEVARRRAQGIQSLSAVLEAGPGVARADIPPPPTEAIGTALLMAPNNAPTTGSQRAYANAGRALLALDRDRALAKFPQLAHLPPV